MTVKVAIIGSGNIGTDLMMKITRLSETLELVALVGIDAASDGLARARSLGIRAVSDGVEGLKRLPEFPAIEIVFDATSAGAHRENAAALAATGVRVIDLTPAALGPFVIPSVNLGEWLGEQNMNMVTCGGQATVPIVAAVGEVVAVRYAEIVASIASASAGPGTRANIDEFTETTRRAIVVVGKAARGKAIIVLNPAEPPLNMRDTVQLVTRRLSAEERTAVTGSIADRVAEVAEYVPGYRMKQEVQFLDEGPELDLLLDPDDRTGSYTRTQVFLEVAGAGDSFPEYAGNLDIMTAAALRTAEQLVLTERATRPQAVLS